MQSLILTYVYKERHVVSLLYNTIAVFFCLKPKSLFEVAQNKGDIQKT